MNALSRAWRWFDDRTRDWNANLSLWKCARWPLLAVAVPAAVHWYWMLITLSWRWGGS